MQLPVTSFNQIPAWYFGGWRIAQGLAFGRYKSRTTDDDTDVAIGFERAHLAPKPIGMTPIISVETGDELTASEPKPLVLTVFERHRPCMSDQPDAWIGNSLNDLVRIIGRPVIEHKQFDIVQLLNQHALHGFGNCCGSVQGRHDNAYPRHRPRAYAAPVPRASRLVSTFGRLLKRPESTQVAMGRRTRAGRPGGARATPRATASR
jgi:hypothetical protein